MSRYVKVGDWIFEIKNIRAIRVDSYGKPYNGIANICVNSDSAYVDGIMTKDVNDFTHNDYLDFMSFCRQLGMTEVNFSGYTPRSDNISELVVQDTQQSQAHVYSKTA